MLEILVFIFSFIFSFFRTKKNLAIHNAALTQQIFVLKRTSGHSRFYFSNIAKIILVVLNKIHSLDGSLHLITPSTLLSYQKKLTASFWNFFSKKSHPGRPPVPAWIKQIILKMKNENFLWGAKRIRDELFLKLGISLDKKTIQKIINHFRHKGKIAKTLSWGKFLKSQAASILATDFFTVDTILNKRFYVIFFISIQSREIVRFAITDSPAALFVKQQLIEIESSFNQFKYIIHDNASQFLVDYSLYGFVGVPTVIYSPNMNAFAERFVKSIRTEALDYHVIVSQKQIFNIVSQYIQYYNSLRPHQGINSIPNGIPPCVSKINQHSNIKSKPILGGLHHHYYVKEAA